MSIEVYLERGKKKVFASAYDWPGWSRGAADDEAALEALAAYADRYAAVVEPAGFSLPPVRLNVVDQVAGTPTTDFGVPHEITGRDRTRITAAKAERLADLVAVCWAALDSGVARAPAELRKGPRGGGRDRDGVVRHVREAERAYAAKIGVRIGPREYGDPEAVGAGRARILEALRIGGGPPEKGWPVRYAARRIAWHVLDHLWEIEDKS